LVIMAVRNSSSYQLVSALNCRFSILPPNSATDLKDASASAIYGVRAANGVVIITTKKGSRNQDAKITYNGYIGIELQVFHIASEFGY